jgi:hypothetical protein
MSVEGLREWGHDAHIAAPIGRIEGSCLGEALVRDPIRSRIAELLTKVPPKNKDEPELLRLRRMHGAAAHSSSDNDLTEAIEAILTFEQCYRIVLLGLERILWLCKVDGSVTAKKVARDPVVNQCCEAIVGAALKFQQALLEGLTEHFRQDLDRLDDVKAFLSNAANAEHETQNFVDVLLDRHADVQRGKFDRGRRKLPWIERKSNRYELTLSQVGDTSGEPKTVKDIRPHEYRLATADRFIAAKNGEAA